MDRLQSMRTFVRVVDEQSFAAAARALDMAPSVVTRLVADLEAHLGVRLLQRSTRRLALTSAGEQYLERTRAILEDIEETESLAATSSLRPSGRVRILVPPAFSLHQLVKHLPRFREQYPEIAIDMSHTGMLDIADESFDVSILLAHGELDQGDFVARRLATTYLVLCASPGYLLEHGTPASPNELAQHRSLALSTNGLPRTCSMRRTGIDGVAEHVEPNLFVTLTSQQSDTLLESARSGLGIVALPSFVVTDALVDGSLVRILADWTLAEMTLYAAMPTRMYVPAKTRAFMAFLTSTFSAEGDPWLH